MNLKEEELAHWWAEYVLKVRKYDILIRNLYVMGKRKHQNEFDGVGLKLKSGRLDSNVTIEDIEFKYTEPGKESYSIRELREQIKKIQSFGGFDYIIGVSNSPKVVQNLPRWAGAVVVDTPRGRAVGAKEINSPQRLSFNQTHRENILKVIRQVYSTVEKIGMPCIFVKCSHPKCRQYYGFDCNEPLPVLFDKTGHSYYCPEAKDAPKHYLYGKAGFSCDNRTFYVARVNKPF